MPRRTKLTIAALFLVLLTIPVVYLFLSWSPAQPLRFRLVTPQPGPGELWPQRVVFEVENTSAVSIHLLIASWEEAADSKGVGNSWGSLLKNPNPGLTGSGFDGSQTIKLAPHSTLRLENTMSFDPGYGGPELGKAEIHHGWVSQPKYLACAWIDALFSHLPESLQDFRPTLDIDEDIGPLKPAPATTTASTP